MCIGDYSSTNIVSQILYVIHWKVLFTDGDIIMNISTMTDTLRHLATTMENNIPPETNASGGLK